MIISYYVQTAPPPPPPEVRIVDTGSDNVSLEWSPPDGDGGSPITGYYVEKCQHPTSRWVKVNEKNFDWNENSRNPH